MRISRLPLCFPHCPQALSALQVVGTGSESNRGSRAGECICGNHSNRAPSAPQDIAMLPELAGAIGSAIEESGAVRESASEDVRRARGRVRTIEGRLRGILKVPTRAGRKRTRVIGLLMPHFSRRDGHMCTMPCRAATQEQLATPFHRKNTHGRRGRLCTHHHPLCLASSLLFILLRCRATTARSPSRAAGCVWRCPPRRMGRPRASCWARARGAAPGEAKSAARLPNCGQPLPLLWCHLLLVPTCGLPQGMLPGYRVPAADGVLFLQHLAASMSACLLARRRNSRAWHTRTSLPASLCLFCVALCCLHPASWHVSPCAPLAGMCRPKQQGP